MVNGRQESLSKFKRIMGFVPQVSCTTLKRNRQTASWPHASKLPWMTLNSMMWFPILRGFYSNTAILLSNALLSWNAAIEFLAWVTQSFYPHRTPWGRAAPWLGAL